ncbi:MAG: hypothetical protein IJ074_07110 [Clostridia bacterium]|nr:hypothetical protein [Clostridia bacterium]
MNWETILKQFNDSSILRTEGTTICVEEGKTFINAETEDMREDISSDEMKMGAFVSDISTENNMRR